jgi:hypothetical protein
MSFSQRGYPIGALFVLVTLSAVLIGGITPLVRVGSDEVPETVTFLAAIGVGAFCGIVAGVILGLLQFRIGLGVIMGGTLGAILGIIAGLMALLSSTQIVPAALAMSAGSALVVGVAFVMRRAM